jgi:hypothetical protein
MAQPRERGVPALWTRSFTLSRKIPDAVEK